MRKIICAFLCVMTLAVILPVGAAADLGPKDSVHVRFENMGDEICYGTLLSKYDSTGPVSVWDGRDDHIYNYDLDMDIWRAFVEYEDKDGYFFLQNAWEVSETKEIDWGYYPPDVFKILLYYPESGTFIASDVYGKYAFSSYYTVDMSGVDIGSVDMSGAELLTAYRSYNYIVEIISLLCRIVITIFVEICIAFVFGYTTKRQITLIARVNIMTQIILNVLLNIINYRSGLLTFVLFYLLFELIVFVIEAVVYYKRLTDQRKWMTVVYAFFANAASFISGILIAYIIPEIL